MYSVYLKGIVKEGGRMKLLNLSGPQDAGLCVVHARNEVIMIGYDLC